MPPLGAACRDVVLVSKPLVVCIRSGWAFTQVMITTTVKTSFLGRPFKSLRRSLGSKLSRPWSVLSIQPCLSFRLQFCERFRGLLVRLFATIEIHSLLFFEGPILDFMLQCLLIHQGAQFHDVSFGFRVPVLNFILDFALKALRQGIDQDFALLFSASRCLKERGQSIRSDESVA